MNSVKLEKDQSPFEKYTEES